MTNGQPADLEQVRYALRLGWVVAELRGRYRPDRFGKHEPGNSGGFKRKDFELPLANERSQTEIRIELFEAAEDLSGVLRLDLRDEHGKPVLEQIKTLLESMNQKDADLQRIWAGESYQLGIAYRFFKWDAQVQDSLVLHATQAAAYQLGRGLAETYWALHTDRPAYEMGSWESVLGEHRRDTLLRLVARLSAYMDPLVLAAVGSSLRAWSNLAVSTDRRGQPDVQVKLFQQGLLWRDLVRGERQPEDLLTNQDLDAPASADIWKELQLYQDATKSLKWPLISGLIGISLLVAGAALLASGASNTSLTTAVGLLGGIGLTSASLYAKAKAQAMSLLSDLRQRIQTERVSQAANLCPGVAATKTLGK
jgi:hypothetical protein